VEKKPNRRKSNGTPRQQQKNDATSQAIIALKNTIAEEGNANRQQEGREDRWNKIIASLTLFLVFCTTGGIIIQDIIIHSSDSAFQISATAAKDAAEAAKQSADVLFNSERARLFIGTVMLKKTSDTDPRPQIDYSWINLGRGPAVITGVLVTCTLVGTQLPTNPIDDIKKIKTGQATLGPNASSTTAPVPFQPCFLDQQLTPDDWKEIGAKTKFILFSGFVRYRDSFHKYKWRFGDVYFGDTNFFSTNPLPPSYNEEIQEDEKK
jgi:hypothetical protein